MKLEDQALVDRVIQRMIAAKPRKNRRLYLSTTVTVRSGGNMSSGGDTVAVDFTVEHDAPADAAE